MEYGINWHMTGESTRVATRVIWLSILAFLCGIRPHDARAALRQRGAFVDNQKFDRPPNFFQLLGRPNRMIDLAGVKDLQGPTRGPIVALRSLTALTNNFSIDRTIRHPSAALRISVPETRMKLYGVNRSWLLT